MKIVISVILTLIFVGSTLAQDCGCLWSYTGRVQDQYGRSVNQAKVTFDGCKDALCTSWRSETTYTNSFGYFTFKDIEGLEFLIQIRHSKKGAYVGMVYYWSAPQTFLLTKTANYANLEVKYDSRGSKRIEIGGEAKR